MPKQTSRQKGDDLENAVRAIEDTILCAAPDYATGTFKIQGKRIFNVAGVRHEVDIFVTASLPAGYEATFIFECKNWTSKVGKNELIVFSEKISALGASKGFFVASSFTRDAQAQAAKDPRIQLLTALHFQPMTRVLFPQFHLRHMGATHAHVTVSGFGRQGKRVELNPEGQQVSIRGQLQAASEYVNALTTQFRDQRVNQLPMSDLQEGKQDIEFEGEVSFAENEAFFGDKPMRSIQVRGTTELSVAVASVLSIYEVQTRGRMIVVAASAGGIEMQVKLIQINDSTLSSK